MELLCLGVLMLQTEASRTLSNYYLASTCRLTNTIILKSSY